MKKEIIAIVIAAVVLAALVIGFGIYGGEDQVTFEEVKGEQIPRKLQAEIIPAHRDLERALVCKVEEDVYVIAMRGEKPTSGYEVQISKLELVTENQKNKLIVSADFADPEKPENMAQVKSYPVSVVKADMKGLPDTVELKAQYPKE